jgi:hypothetical protein
MIIYITKSKLFTVDPAIRFAKEYNCDVKLWNEMWRRHTLLQYTNKELCEYFYLKTQRQPKPKSIRRWIVRTEIYCLANHALRMGARVVQSEYFRDFEKDVIKELVQNMRFNGKQSNRSLL